MQESDSSTPTLLTIKNEILLYARELEFDLITIASPVLDAKHQSAFTQWIKAKKHGEMDYLARRVREQKTIYSLLPEVKSIIVLGTNYYRRDVHRRGLDEGEISRYAATRDYHKIITKKLKKLSRFIADEFGGETRYYVDTGPILERAYAESSGMGYIGRNTCIINDIFGSWIFLAEVLTTLSLPSDHEPIKIHCGSCSRCLDRCPTRAISHDFTIDARKCISYLTIENKGAIPKELRKAMGGWLFGCDICQDVCPHNGRAIMSESTDFTTTLSNGRFLSLEQLLAIRTDAEFLQLFAGTPMTRAKRRGMLRNACVVAGNSGQIKLLSLLRQIIEHEDEMLGEHAQWAITELERN